MQEKDIQRLAFLSLCGEKDKKILTGKQKMTFADFDRLTYLTDFFELIEYNLEIWKECSAQFEQNFQALQKLCEENDIGVDFELSECDFDQNSLWLIDFCRNVPDKANKIFLKEFVKKKYKDEGMEFPERFEKI